MITVERIKQIIPISPNIDASKISPQIPIVELMFIKPLLGKLLYKDISDKYNTQTLSNIEKDLLNLIQPTISFYVLDNILPYLTFSVNEKGIQQQNGINSIPADSQSSFSSLNYMRNEFRNKAEWYSSEIIKFLEDNLVDFPLYTTSTNNPDKGNQFDCGIAFFDIDLNKRNSSYFV